MKSFETEYSDETLRKLQLVEYDILKKFDTMCTKYHLEYFAMYGTLLGAVRHQGIIPWDDDIDIVMPRIDFEKLKTLVPVFFGEGYVYMDNEIDSNYPFVTGRIMKKGTEFRMRSMKNVPIDLGVFLDIFPLDRIPDEEWKWKKMLLKTWLYEKLLILRNTPFPNLPYRGIKRGLMYTFCFLGSLCIKPFSSRKLYLLWKHEATQYTDIQTKRFAVCSGIEVCTFSDDQLYPLKKIRFEDMKIPVPNKEREVLIILYGPNYMIPPPKGERSYIVPYRLNLGDGVILR